MQPIILVELVIGKKSKNISDKKEKVYSFKEKIDRWGSVAAFLHGSQLVEIF